MSTIKDVARLAGVSASTVSRTLTNRVYVDEATRQKVLHAAKELHYRPNLAAKGLREGKSGTLALLVPDINSFFYPQIMKAVEKEAAVKGYTLFLVNTDEDPEREKKAVRTMISRGVDGILCLSVEDDTSHLEETSREEGVPVVLLNRFGTKALSSVSVDDEDGGYLMVKYLLKKGHRKIAALFGRAQMQRFRSRRRGAETAMREYGVTGYEERFLDNISTIEEAYRATAALMKEKDRPTAVFASMDILAIGAYRAIREAGLSIPEDVSVTGFDNIAMTEFMTPPLTTYEEPFTELAKNCVAELARQIEGGRDTRKSVFRGRVLERESVCPPAAEDQEQERSGNE